MERRLAKGAGWLANHPRKDDIARRDLRQQRCLDREALARLVGEEEIADDEATEAAEESLETPLGRNARRRRAVRVQVGSQFRNIAIETVGTAKCRHSWGQRDHGAMRIAATPRAARDVQEPRTGRSATSI